VAATLIVKDVTNERAVTREKKRTVRKLAVEGARKFVENSGIEAQHHGLTDLE